jgi:radical SAM-linked protein
MLAIRVKFKKEGLAKYISHLDLNRYMQRALRRAHIPIWNTQGYNPHPYIVFSMPLSIFFESDCEIMDARLDEEMPLDDVKNRLSEQMPDGISIISVTEPVMKLADIAFASYSITLDYDRMTKQQLDCMINSIKSAKQLTVDKKSKRNTIQLDMKKYFESAKCETKEGVVNIAVTLPSSSQKMINPSYLIDAINIYGKESDFQSVRRLMLYNGEMEPFF